ncbi:MAG TPA: hypothetical protein VFG91_09505 [Woeseiaceae bacterium]|nr:hypothetical protein [Woeseiaceae bacterium]
MKRMGVLLFLPGAGSILLGFLGFEFRLLIWVDNWGTAVGRAIRGVLMLVGVALWFMGYRAEALNVR